jgi:hypothetical protein
MPLLRFSEHRLDPDLALADRFLVGLRRVVATDLLKIVLIGRALDRPPAIAVRALGLDWTGIAGGRVSSVDHDPLGPLAARKGQRMALWAAILIPSGVVGELVPPVEGRPVLEIG